MAALGTILRRVGPATGPLLPSAIFGGNLVGWWAADSGFANSGLSSVSWADLSGNGNTLTKGNSLGFATSVAAVQNGLPAIEFVNSPNATFLINAAIAVAQPFSVFIVCQWASAFTVNSTAWGDNGATANLTEKGAANVSVSAGATLQYLAATPQSWHEWASVLNGASSLLQSDGVIQASGAGGSSSLAQFVVAAINTSGTNGGNLNVGEIIIASTAATPVQLGQMHGYLSNRWATP